MNPTPGILSLLTLLMLVAPRADAQLSNEQAEERVLGEALAPLLARIEGEAERPIEVEIQGLGGGSQNFGRGVVDFLAARGHEAKLRRASSGAAASTLVLELEVLDAVFSQTESRRHFLGLAPVKFLRRLDLVMVATLSDAASGRTLFDGILEAHAADWLHADLVVERASNSLLPARSPAATNDAKEAPAPTGWTERGIALGLLSGVIILFYSGIS